MVEFSKLNTGSSIDFEQIEKDRVAYVKKAAIGKKVITILLLCAAITNLLPFGWIVGIPAVVLLVMVGFFTVFLPHRKFRKSFKSAVIEKVLHSVNPDLTYHHKEGIQKATFLASGIYNVSPNHTYHSEDLISGLCGKTNLQLAEVNLRDNRESDFKDYQPINILFFVADFHKHFQGQTYVVPKRSLLKKMKLFTCEVTPDLPKIEMEDVEFDLAFDIHADNPTEARYILSIAMLRRITDMQSKYGAGLRFAFKDSCVWIGIPLNGEFLEPDENRSVYDQKQLTEMAADIEHFLSLVEELDLNTRIWTKH